MKKSFNRLIRRVASGALAAAAVLTAAAGAFPAGRAFAAEYADSPDGYSADSLPSYREYRSIYADRSRPETAVVLTAADAVGTVRKYTDYEGREGEALYTDETDTAAFEFEVAESGLYHLLFEYYPAEGNGGAIERTVAIDGAVPFQEAENLSFSRIWANASGEVKEDIQGNQILIEQVETPRWTTQYAIDPSGIATEPLAFYLEAGSHTLTVEGVMEPMVIGSISFLPLSASEAPSYQEAEQQYGDAEPVAEDTVIRLQGEEATSKSSQMLYPLSDKDSPSVEPYDWSRIVYNTIGGSQWTNSGEWIEWEFEAPESGLYYLSAHFRQSLKDSRASVRSVSIDGKSPFQETQNWIFPYDSAWQCGWFADENGEPYAVYLDKGPHTLRLTVSLGDYSEIISEASELLERLNAVYRSVIAISGANPDPYRDYRFDQVIPETIEEMRVLNQDLKELEKQIMQVEDDNKTVADIRRICVQLDMMLEDTDTISRRLTALKDNIASYGTWINQQRGQPLELDWLQLSSDSIELPKGDAGFFGWLAHNIKRFLISFVTDYEKIGQTTADTDSAIKIWMTSSQDQAQLMRQLIVSDFIPQTGISAEVQLVALKSLLPSILANKGPDVALGIAQTAGQTNAQVDVNNLAIRNALYDLSEFSDIDEVKDRFYDYSLRPFEWNGGLYALPETQTWSMLFYRKDILNELDISLGELGTWDSILSSVLPKLKKSSLSFGIMPTIQNYITFLYQSGGSLYTEDGMESALNSSEAVESMRLFSVLYTQYGFQLSYDFSNRFRNGEMPVAIAEFTSYNNLMLFAPEIKGLWGMLPVPGTVREDGTVDHTTVATLTGTVMMANTQKPDEAWQFMKWWASDETQDTFGKRLEAVVGTASRYNTANRSAMARVQWDPDVKESMQQQAAMLREYPEVPGGYFTSRLFNFAFRSIVYDSDDVRESMNDVAEDISLEMKNKRDEYGIK